MKHNKIRWTALTAALCLLTTSMPVCAAEDERPVVALTLDALVAKDPSFPNNEVFYSDKYQTALEVTKEGSTKLIVYGLDISETKMQENSHITVNRQYNYQDLLWYPAGHNRYFYSGLEYLHIEQSSKVKFEKNFDILFMVKNELPYWADSLPQANESYGFDIAPYIYPFFYDGSCEIGDMNGDGGINTTDAIAVLKLYAQSLLSDVESTIHPKQLEYGDVNTDGKLDVNDAVKLLKQYAESLLQ